MAADQPDTVLTIPVPRVRPLGTEITRDAVQMVWDLYVKPVQEAEMPPSIEERILMAILRAVYAGLPDPLAAASDGRSDERN